MKRLMTILLLAAMLLTACASAEPLALTAVNVGKADCLLLESGRTLYMIDTGTAESWGAVSAALRERGIDHLTGVIVTHADRDHAGGAWALASSGIVVDAWYTSAWCADKKDEKNPVMKAAALRGQRVTKLKAGDVLPMDGGSLTVLGPREESDTENDNSVVLLAQGGGGSMLLAGDMEFPEEQTLLGAGVLRPCTVLKVGNHGESDATSEAFVRAVKPQLAVISTNSAEEPDTPSSRVLKALKGVGAQIALTQSGSGGVLAVVEDGRVQVSLLDHPAWPEAVSGVRITDRNSREDTVELRNDGAANVDLSGWFLYSERGSETFVFPEGAVLAPGQRIVIASLTSDMPGDYLWRETKVWHEKKDDACALYDAYGRLMDRME